MVWYSHHFMNFSQSVVINIVKGFRVVNKAEDFLGFSCFFFVVVVVVVVCLFVFSVFQRMLEICGSSAFSNPACASGNSQFMYFRE